MKTIAISSINIGERVRRHADSEIETLARDIHTKGLLHPIVVDTEKDLNLIAGEGRLRAINLIDEWAESGEINPFYTHDEQTLSSDVIPFVTVGELSSHEMLEYEIAENIIRFDIPWQQRVMALNKLHATTESKTINDTVRVMVSAGDKRAPSAINAEVSKACIIASCLDDPNIASAKSSNEAWTRLAKTVTAQSRRVLQSIDEPPTIESPHNFIPAPFETADLEPESFDTIVTDPPYGTEADTWTSKFRTGPHAYDDSHGHAMTVCHDILRQGYELCKPQANLFMFCAPQHWNILRDMAEALGWSTWPRPIVWRKSNEGIRPWGIKGLCYTFESILYATKGQKGLLSSINDIIDIPRVTNSVRLHPAQKPVDLIAKLIEISSMPFDRVLDPCAGSGTIFPAATATKTVATGCERDPNFWPICRERLIEGITLLPVETDNPLETL